MTLLTAQELDAPYPYVVSEELLQDVSRLLRAAGVLGGSTSVVLAKAAQGRRRSILELRGLGKEVWAGIDATEYVDKLRDEWDAR
ncbi:MAG: hypothetical protein HYZ53_20865 [Planctomycetes bacterium]|nr:hypothetical protein [Planctomycetota bacterium]